MYNELKHIVWIDCETGGRDPDAHQITQIAAVVTDEKLKLVSGPFERKIRLYDGAWEQEALDVQGYDSAVWAKEAVEAHDALSALIEYVKPFTHLKIGRSNKRYSAAHVGGHNVGFDRDFLRASAKRLRLWLPLTLWSGGMFDTMELAKWHAFLRGVEHPRYRLEELCEEAGIPMPGRAHDAMTDIMASVLLARHYVTEITEMRFHVKED